MVYDLFKSSKFTKPNINDKKYSVKIVEKIVTAEAEEWDKEVQEI